MLLDLVPCFLPYSNQVKHFSSVIANQFNDASSDLHIAALMGAAIILLAIAVAINIVAHILVTRMLKVREGVINN